MHKIYLAQFLTQASESSGLKGMHIRVDFAVNNSNVEHTSMYPARKNILSTTNPLRLAFASSGKFVHSTSTSLDEVSSILTFPLLTSQMKRVILTVSSCTCRLKSNACVDEAFANKFGPVNGCFCFLA